MSRVTCHMSPVACHMSLVGFLFYFFLLLFFRQSGEASQRRVCYQRGLPRLVLPFFVLTFTHFKTHRTFNRLQKQLNLPKTLRRSVKIYCRQFNLQKWLQKDKEHFIQTLVVTIAQTKGIVSIGGCNQIRIGDYSSQNVLHWPVLPGRWRSVQA